MDDGWVELDDVANCKQLYQPRESQHLGYSQGGVRTTTKCRNTDQRVKGSRKKANKQKARAK